ncbi:MAG: outer membrane lipoprotein carrier protein LolA [Bryobacteraceae bacterium]
MKALSGFLVVSAATLVVSPALWGGTLQQVLASMDRAAQDFKAMSANIERVAHTAVINQNDIERGTMRFKRASPHDVRARIDLVEPDPKSAAVQGGKAELYYPKINTVQEYDMGKNRELFDQYMLLGFGVSGKELGANYELRVLGEEQVNGQKTTRLELIPKSQQVQQHLKKVELWISEATGNPARQKLFLTAGDYNLMTFSDVKINPKLSDGDLKLKLPKGVKREYPNQARR